MSHRNHFSLVLKRNINLILRRVLIFSICGMVIFGLEKTRMSVLFMTSHWPRTAPESHESWAYWTLHASAALKQQRHALIQDILQQSRNGDSPVCLFLFCSSPSPTSVQWFREGSPGVTQ